jgi:tetratricopeptide (TPR) repeat protein
VVRSPQLQKEWTLFDKQEYERAFEQARSALDGLAGPDLRDAYRLLGMACHHQKRHGEATFWFTRACQASDDAGDWLNLAVSATMQGDMELSSQAIEQVRICQQVARYVQGPGFYVHLYWYACALCDKEEHQRLQDVLDELAQAFRRLQRTDTAFVYARRLPFLSSVLALATRHFRAQGKQAEGLAWLQALGQVLDEQGQRQVDEAMQELRQGDGAAPTADMQDEH